MTVVLTLFIGQYEVAWEAMSAAAVVTIIPPLIMALFFPTPSGAWSDLGGGEVTVALKENIICGVG